MKPLTWTTGKARLCDLEEYDKNPVQISERDAKELARSLKKFGHIIPYTAAAPKNGTKVPILDGHQRKKVEIELLNVDPKSVVEVRFPSRKLTDKERQEAIIRLRKNTGKFDPDGLLNWFEADDLLDWGFNEKELKEVGFEFEDGTTDAEPQIDRAAELLEKWQVKTGDLWQIGEHRLICGDCTDAATVARVMGSEKATLMFTDPPYEFETDGGWFNGKIPKVMDGIKEAGINIFDPFPFLETLGTIFSKGYHSSFIFCNKALVHKYLNYAVDNGFAYNILVWKKHNVMPFGDSHFPDIEYLIFIRKSAKWNNGTDANRSKVLVYDQDFETQKDHPTPKPLAFS